MTHYLHLLNSRNAVTAPNQRLLPLSSFPFTMLLRPSCTTNSPLIPMHDLPLLRALVPVHHLQCTLRAQQNHGLQTISPMQPLLRLKCSRTWFTPLPHQQVAHRIRTSCTNSHNLHQIHQLLHTLLVFHHPGNLRSCSHSR